VKAKDVSHTDVVQLITGGALVKEGDEVKVVEPKIAALDDPENGDAGTGGTGARP
jgi:hypothetical protein